MSLRRKRYQLEDLEEQIISYYKKGYSQKDMKEHLQVSYPYIRKVLNSNGYSTHDYRAISKETKDIITILIFSGYSYRTISQILDISFHVIREVKENPDFNENNLDEFVVFNDISVPLYDTFISEYMKGFSFLYLFEKYKCTLKDVSQLAKLVSLQKETLKEHNKQLVKRINTMLKDSYPVHMIAKKMCISVSVVKKQSRQNN